MPRILAVTSSNAPYFPFAQDLILSLRDKPFRTSFSIALLDTGLEPEQKAWCEAAGVLVKPAARTFDHPNLDALEAQNPSIRTLTAQMCIPALFPDADVFLWIDADMWIQTAEAIDETIEALLAGDPDAIAIAPEFDRCYPAFFEEPSKMWEIYRIWYAANFGEQFALQMLFRPMFNVGFWAIRRSSSLWESWLQRYRDVLVQTKEINNCTFMAHQLTLNILLSLERKPHIILPALYNWLTVYALPAYDPKSRLFVEPLPPYRPISVLHLTRQIKAQKEVLSCRGGGSLTTSLMRRGRPTAGKEGAN